MGTTSLSILTDRLMKDDEMFGKYYRANGVFYDTDEEWDEETRKVHCCAISEVDYNGCNECMRQQDTDHANTLTWTITTLTLCLLTSLFY